MGYSFIIIALTGIFLEVHLGWGGMDIGEEGWLAGRVRQKTRRKDASTV